MKGSSRAPRPSVLRRAVRYRNLDGAFTKAMDTLTGGPFLAGLALALGASNLEIGFIAAIPFLSKVMFIPATWMVERFGRRRRICVLTTLLGRPLLLGIALAALFWPPARARAVLMGGLAVYSMLATFAGLAWNVWMKDLVPARLRGRVFSRRLWLMGLTGTILSLIGALVVDAVRAGGGEVRLPLAGLFAAGALAGLVGIVFLSRIPEVSGRPLRGFSLRRALARPFQDPGFRRLIGFSSGWAFATNLALPFITVVMLRELGLSFLWVMGMTIASQLANLSFLPLWGRIADRFGNKAVLFLCAPVFSLSFLLWTFTVEDLRWVTLGLILLIHVMSGLATAGIDVANDNLLFQLAPAQAPTAYFATAALTNSLAAGVAPVLGGWLAGALEGHTLAFAVRWDAYEITALSFAHFDFVFLLAFALGLVALRQLQAVREREREPAPELVLKSVRQEIQTVSTVKGMRHLTQAASFFAGLVLESGRWVRLPSLGATSRED